MSEFAPLICLLAIAAALLLIGAVADWLQHRGGEGVSTLWRWRLARLVACFAALGVLYIYRREVMAATGTTRQYWLGMMVGMFMGLRLR